MKLYATVTSERASKGQGGNEYLEIKLTVKQGNEIETFGVLKLEKEVGHYVLKYCEGNNGLFQTIDYAYDRAAQVITKGEKQKDESCDKCKATKGGRCADCVAW